MPSSPSRATPSVAGPGPGDAARGSRTGPVFRWFGEVLAVAGVYAALVWVGQLTAIEPGTVTAVYPSAGLAVACVLVRGRRIWPGIWIGHLIGNSAPFLASAGPVPTTQAVAVAAVTSVGATLQALAGAALVRRWVGTRFPFDTVRGVFRFAASGVLACLISASLGISALRLGGFPVWSASLYAWWTWYVGDLIGYVVVGSALVILLGRPHRRRTWSRFEATGVLVAAAATAAIALVSPSTSGAGSLVPVFLPLPLIIWAAVRLDKRVVSLAVLIVGAVAVAATRAGSGPFVDLDTNLSLIFLALFLGVLQISGLSLRAAFLQLSDARQELSQLNQSMEATIRRRTAELEEQRRFLRQIIDVDPNFIFAKDREGRFTLVNQAVAEAYGTTVNELMGRLDADFNPNQDEVEQFRRIDRRVIDNREEMVIPEEKITDAAGRVRWLQTVKRPLLGRDGRADQILGSATDITLRKQVEEQLRHSEAELRHSQAELRDLTRRLMTAEEDEKRRLARHLHDDLTQWLAAAALQAARLQQIVLEPTPEVVSLLATLRGELERLSTSVHALSRGLHPSILDDLGLIDALSSECSQWETQEGVRVHLEVDPGVPEPTGDAALCFYRVTQEALRNVAKHARAREVEVLLEQTPEGTALTIADRGDGFDPGRRLPEGGLGLVSMAERARMIGADLSVSSHPGRGTVVRLTLPGSPGAG